MLHSFILITFRILLRNKVISFINIFSLSVGIMAFIFIMLYVQYETSYDKFNINYDRIYRLESDGYGKLPPSLGMHLKLRVPEIENVAFMAWQGRGYLSYDPAGNAQNRIQVDGNGAMADSTTFDVLSFSFVSGDPTTALKNPMAIVVTESFAKKLFRKDDPMGKTVDFHNFPYMITGVIRDINASHVEIDYLVSMSSVEKIIPGMDLNKTAANWAWSATYLLVNEGVDPNTIDDKINRALSEINDGILIDTKFERFSVRPLKDLYFHGDVEKQAYGLHGNFNTILVLITIAILMLTLSGVNYVNLTIVRSATRSKEIAVKRVSGSSASLLRLQLIGESVIISLVSLAVALTLVQPLLPRFNELTGVNIHLRELNYPLVWIEIIGGGILIGLLAGIYPAFIMTAIEPLKLIKGGSIRGSGSFFKNGMMTFQFALSVVMIVAILVISRQLTFVQTADLGFQKEQIICIETPVGIPNEMSLRNDFKARLRQYAGVEGVCFSYGNPAIFITDSPPVDINGSPRTTKILLTGDDYLNVMGITLKQGRGFNMNIPSDQAQWGASQQKTSVLLNETAAREFHAEVGQLIYKSDPSLPLSKRESWEVIGIVKDFHFRSFHDKIEPLVFQWISYPGLTASIKVSPSNLTTTIANIETEFKSVWGLVPYSYDFMDDAFNRQYKNDRQLASVIGYFAILAIIIACLGLFALSSFMVSSRIKEIGVRKMLGASVGTIYTMLSWDFLKWILIAIVVASPIAWYTMNAWLNTFAYHISVGVDVFIIAAALAMIIAMITVTWQSLKVAKANPVDSLRYE